MSNFVSKALAYARMFCFSSIALMRRTFSGSGGVSIQVESFCHAQLLLEYGHYKVLIKLYMY